MPESQTYYATSQTSPIFSSKFDIWIQISESYSGGQTYRDGDYLHRFTQRESDAGYEERVKRAIYFNNVQPLADLLTGFLFSNPIVRNDYKQDFLIKRASRRQSLDNFMQTVAVNSLMYTVGVLVDSPKFDANIIQTEADRKAVGLNPYCTLYQPWQIRNYYCDDAGSLKWVLLDNSYYDNSDPYKQATYVTKYRLWTDTYYQDFESVNDTTQIKNVTDGTQQIIQSAQGVNFKAGELVGHDLGEVPFIFVNWANRTGEKYEDTIFEDIALFDQSIYNYMSYMDEMLAGGTFKFLFYPGSTPDAIKSGSFSNLSVIPYPDQINHKPFFDGPSLGDIDPFLKSIEFLLSGILRKLGLNTDSEKNYVQSGAAKFFDFTKTRALLSSGASSMQETEREIFRLSGLWLSTEDNDVTIEYQKDFLGEEAARKMESYYQALTLPYSKMKEYAAKEIAKNTFEGLSEKDVKEITDDIENESKEDEETNQDLNINVNELAEQQKQENLEKETEENDRAKQ